MDKNDFDIDFDFDKEYGLGEDDLSGQASDDTQGAGQDFDLSQFEDDGSGGDQFQDFDMDDEEFAKLMEEDPGQMDADQDYSENDAPEEDLIFPRRDRQQSQQDDGPEYDGQYDPQQEQGGYDPNYDPEQGYDAQGEYDQGSYDQGGYDPNNYDPQQFDQGDYDGQPQKPKKKLTLPKLPKLPKREKKERREPAKPSLVSRFMDWYMEPINRRKNPEPETVDENGRRRRRKRPTRAQIIKEAYLPPLFALIAAVAAGVGMAMNNDTAYVICIIFIVLTIAADATVMVLSRKLNIPIKYRENYFRFGKNKKDKK